MKQRVWLVLFLLVSAIYLAHSFVNRKPSPSQTTILPPDQKVTTEEAGIDLEDTSRSYKKDEIFDHRPLSPDPIEETTVTNETKVTKLTSPESLTKDSVPSAEQPSRASEPSLVPPYPIVQEGGSEPPPPPLMAEPAQSLENFNELTPQIQDEIERYLLDPQNNELVSPEARLLFPENRLEPTPNSSLDSQVPHETPSSPEDW